MSQGIQVWLVIAAALVVANLPFVNERLFVLGPRRAPKALGWRLVELAVFAVVAWGVGAAIETAIGQRAPQRWEFYAAGICLFLVFAFPGFTWRYLRRRRDG